MSPSPAGPLEAVLAELVADGRIAHVERRPARPARTAALSGPLPAPVDALVPAGGLWTHQAEAVDLVRAGRSVVVATGTASGKSLCYQLPIAAAVTEAGGSATALLLFPTKALAQDQLRALGQLEVPGLVPVTYDGDTAPEARTWARRHANVVLTNPDMLHAGLLPHHGRWATFLHRLQIVVVDELHVLRGVFGTHVAHLLRRLRRLCAHYGSDPVFVFSSATIGDPARLASELCGRDVVAVTDDGSPRGERLLALLDPPVIDPELGTRVSAHAETAGLVAELVRRDHRAIAFTRSRPGTELVCADARRRLPGALASTVRPYRGGYLATERREIEAELFAGRLRAVVATTALELGVDIGGLDACVLDGFPGTIASMWQQAGRAGREAQTSLAVVVAGNDQLDRWFVAHPAELFTRPAEPAVINTANPFVLAPHLACAAHELPLRRDDAAWWGDLLDDGIRDLVGADLLRIRPRADGEPVAYWAGRGGPAHGVGLRSGSSREVRIVTADGRLIGTVDEARAPSSVHDGAIYLHQGQTWRVTHLDLGGLAATVVADPGDTTTQARSDTSVEILAEDRRRPVGAATLSLGAVRVRTQVVGYQRRDVRTREVLATESLDLPPSELDTRAVWYQIDPDTLAAAGVGPDAAGGALHAVEHTAIALLPLFTICDRWDVGGVSTALLADTGRPTIVIYDGYPGGAGIAELGFDAADRHLAAALELLERCGCTGGCPSCVQSPKCGTGNEPLDKDGATRLLRTVLDP